MSLLDDRLDAAVQDLRTELDGLEPPAFKPRRSSVPLVFALVLLLGIGAVGYVVGNRADDTGGISVATQPDASDPAQQTADEQAVVPATTERYETRQISSAEAGEFFVPIPGAPAWSRDETHVLLYRTGAATPGHVVVDVRDGTMIDLPFTPPDIEQIYWHPTADNQLLYAVGNELFAFDVSLQESAMAHRFDGCDSVDSGVLPVPPASDGTLSLLCYVGSQVTQVALDLGDLSERRAPTASDSAAFPSPSGDVFVQWNADGSAAVLDRELTDTGVELDLQNNLFTFVTDSGGVEWVATSLFDGPPLDVGTVVLLRLDGLGAPVISVGPVHGDPYPPSGNQLSGTTDRLAVSTSGPLEGPIAGHITVLDFGDPLDGPVRLAIPHGSEGLHGYWSTPFVSIGPSGGSVLYSSDEGTDSVDTFLATVFISDG